MRSVLVISARDNVATALEPLQPGRAIVVSDATVTVREPVASGHKIALVPIAAGEPVIKYGSPIGLATADILPGAHVHVHNLSSSRGRGDLSPQSSDGILPRLAEPPDERAGDSFPPAVSALGEPASSGEP